MDLFIGQQAYPDPDDKNAKPASASTINRRLAAIDTIHHFEGHSPPSKDKRVRATLRDIRNKHGTTPEKKAALMLQDIKKLADACGAEGNRALRDRALFLFGFASAMRRSELVALDRNHLEFIREEIETVDGETGKVTKTERLTGVMVTIPKSKTDQEKKGVIIGVPAKVESPYCPATALDDWMALEHVGEPTVFIRISKGDTLLFKKKINDGEKEEMPLPRRLTDQSVALLIQSYAKKLELDYKRMRDHSLRRGWLTAAAKQEGGALEAQVYGRAPRLY